MDEKIIELEDAANEVIMLTQTTVDRLFEISTDAYVLYSFLYKTAKWQNNNKVWATKSYIEKKLKWGNKRVIAAKKQLIENGFIETVVERDEAGRISRWKIRLKYVKKFKNTTGVESNRLIGQPVDGPTGRQGDPIKLDNNSGELNNNSGELDNNSDKEIYHHDDGTTGVFPPSAILAGWNNLAKQSKRYNIPVLKEITPERAEAFARTMQWLGTDNIDDFFFIVEKALSTSFYLAGKTLVSEGNDYWLEDKPVRGANFDFFTDLEKMRKVLEWEYADGTRLEGWYQKHPEDKDEFPKR